MKNHSALSCVKQGNTRAANRESWQIGTSTRFIGHAALTSSRFVRP